MSNAGDDILTVTFEQTVRVHVTVNLTTGKAIGPPERDDLGPDWELESVRDENGLSATSNEEVRAATIAEQALADSIGDLERDHPAASTLPEEVV